MYIRFVTIHMSVGRTNWVDDSHPMSPILDIVPHQACDPHSAHSRSMNIDKKRSVLALKMCDRVLWTKPSHRPLDFVHDGNIVEPIGPKETTNLTIKPKPRISGCWVSMISMLDVTSSFNSKFPQALPSSTNLFSSRNNQDNTLWSQWRKQAQTHPHKMRKPTPSRCNNQAQNRPCVSFYPIHRQPHHYVLTMSIEPMMPNPDQTSEQRDAQAQKEEQVMRLRGGEACPGRFCFIIPCPIPCNFCVFPCPC